MKTPKEFATYYLEMKLGGRKGFDLYEICQDEDIVAEIIDELADLIEKRDNNVKANTLEIYMRGLNQGTL